MLSPRVTHQSSSAAFPESLAWRHPPLCMVARSLGGFQSADCLLTTSRLQAQFPYLEKGVIVVHLSRKGLVRPLRHRQCPAMSAVFIPHTCTYVAPWVCQELALDRAERGHAQSLLRQAQFCAQDQLKILAGYMVAARPRTTGGEAGAFLSRDPRCPWPQCLHLHGEVLHLMNSSQPCLGCTEPIECSVGKESRQVNLGKK